jgi:hypothetical protein
MKDMIHPFFKRIFGSFIIQFILPNDLVLSILWRIKSIINH